MLFRDTATGPDHLDRILARETLISTIHHMEPPGCVALYGAWGSGKTNLLRALQQDWEGLGGRTAWFDPWEHEGRGDVISPLLHALVVDARRYQTVDAAKVRRAAVRVGKILASLAVRLAGGYFGAQYPKLLDGIKSAKLEDFTQPFDDWVEHENEVRHLKQDFRELVEACLEGVDKKAGKLIVLLDDLDRCLPDNAVGLLEAVKVLLCGVPEVGGEGAARVIFVFGLDRELVGQAIAKRYGTGHYSGENYLEKIFDVSLEVPTITRDHVTELLGRLLHGLQNEAGILQVLGGADLVSSVLVRPEFANPRVLKRSLNRFFLLFRLKKAREDADRLFKRVDGPLADKLPSAELVALNRCRFVAWVAGAERFRSFRHAFFDAGDNEISAFHSACRGDSSTPGAVGDALSRCLAMPGFRAYYEAIVPQHAFDDAITERQPQPEGHVPSLRDFDNLLRQRGL